MSRIPLRPFLITKDVESRFRLTIRETRYNSQGYPLVTETLQEEAFPTAAAAKAYARDQFGAEAGQYATK
jgi:hypothetical protein